MFRHFFSYVPPDPPPEVPEVESPDPNTDRVLSDPFRAARRSLVAVCAVCIAWSTAQFSIEELRFDAAGIAVDLKNASVPLILGAILVYLTVRWTLEFAMMPRHVRRWPLAQLDFHIVWVVARFALLAVTAGALDRSLRSVIVVVFSLGVLILASALLTLALMFVVMPIRMWARQRAGAVSAASAAVEATAWAGLFAVSLSVVGITVLAIASYRYEPWRVWIWPVPPTAVALATFVLALLAVFLSPWLMRPVVRRLFAERPPYFTERATDGSLRVHFRDHEKEPLL